MGGLFWLPAILAILIQNQNVDSLENGLALRPPMGWMHWQRFRCVIDCDSYPDECVSEQLFRTMADHMVSDGYLAAGYEYIIVDDCWSEKERDSQGRLQADAKRFPSGMKALADYVHGKGLKFGMYGDYGNFTCGGYPGSLWHLELDAKTLAEWHVDYWKMDGCYAEGLNFEEGYKEFGRYLNETGRPMIFSCSWPAYEEPEGIESDYEVLKETCNLWRNWDDIDDSWGSMTGIVKWFTDNQDRIAEHSGPGHWNDPDMLIIGNYGLSYEQSISQMTIWSIMAAPLIMSVDFRTIDPAFKKILLNKDALAINQDVLGIQGKLVFTKNKIDVWTKPITPTVGSHHSFGVGFIATRIDGFPYKVEVNLTDIKLDNPNGYTIQNIFDDKEPPYTVPGFGTLSVRVKPTGAVFLKAVPNTK